jgi:ribose transport system ATP-binding protein
VTTPLLNVSGLDKRYAVPVLRGVDFQIHPGRVHALVGANGAGKSTLCRIISGVTAFDEGEMQADGVVYRPTSVRDGEGAGIRMVMQEPHLIDNLNIAENLFFSNMPTRFGMVDYPRLYEQAQVALDGMSLNDLDPRQKVGSLGIGQRQLIEIAKVLTKPCKVLILDEPTAALTDPQIDILFEKISTLRAAGVGVIYVSHRISEFKRIADEITVLRNGKSSQPQLVSDLSSAQIVQMMAGTASVDPGSSRVASRGRAVLKIRDVCAGGLLQNIDLDIYAGEVLGIAGLIGSGRTELLRAIFGADKIDSGYLNLGDDETKVAFSSPQEAVEHGVGLIPEDRVREGLLLTESINNNVTINSIQKFGGRYGIIDKDQEHSATESYREALSIDCIDIGQSVAELSGGNQQKVVIARWLLKDCGILLFDEPTRGIDIQTREAIYELLYRLAAAGKAIVVVSSETRELTSICDRIVVLSNGRLAADFNKDEWSAEKIMAASFSAYTDNAA